MSRDDDELRFGDVAGGEERPEAMPLAERMVEWLAAAVVLLFGLYFLASFVEIAFDVPLPFP